MSAGSPFDPKPCSLKLTAGGGTPFDGTTLDLNWTYQFEGSRAGSFEAKDGRIEITFAGQEPVLAVSGTLMERSAPTGVPHQVQILQFARHNDIYWTQFTWSSLTEFSEQELAVTVYTSGPYAPKVRLRDPASRRTDFLLSLIAKT